MEQRGLVEKGRVTWDMMYLILSLSTRTLIQVLSMVQRRVVPISDVKLFRYLWCDLMAAGEALFSLASALRSFHHVASLLIH